MVVALQVGNDRGTQYRHGVYYHTEEQKTAAQEVFTKVESEVSPMEEDASKLSICTITLTDLESDMSSIRWAV